MLEGSKMEELIGRAASPVALQNQHVRGETRVDKMLDRLIDEAEFSSGSPEAENSRDENER